MEYQKPRPTLYRSSSSRYPQEWVLRIAIAQILFGFLFFAIGASENTSEYVDYSTGYAAILLSILPCIFLGWRNRRRLLLCQIAFSVAPIWFLYLESVIPPTDSSDGTAMMLPGFMRVQAVGVAVVFQGLFGLIHLFTLRLLARYSRYFNRDIASTEFGTPFLVVCTLLAFTIPLIVIGAAIGSFEGLWEALTAGRNGESSGTLLRSSGSLAGSSFALQPLYWLWQLTPSFAAYGVVVSLQKNGRITSFVFVALAAGLSVLFFTFLGGSRGTLMFVSALPIALTFYYGSSYGMKFWVFCLCMGFLAIGIMEFQVRTRGNIIDAILNPSELQASSSDGRITTFNPLQSHRDNNLYFLCLVVHESMKTGEFEGFGDFYAIVLNPIPRALWPNKPVLSGALGFANEAKPVFRSGPFVPGTASLSCSIVGDCFLWAGFFGFLPILAIYSLFAAWFDAWWIKTDKPSLFQVGIQGFAAFLVFWGERAFSAFITFLYPFIVLYFFGLFVCFLNKSIRTRKRAR